MSSQPTLEKATLAAGCFWCIEAVLEGIQGVRSVVSGYTGGMTNDPTYQEVCTGSTGHAEAVEVDFDPSTISYRELLKLFFAFHDPTQLNRQGPDVGTQYRSAIYYHSDQQRDIATSVLAEMANSALVGDRMVTEIQPVSHFYRAESYHQGYYRANRGQPYCQILIDPKMVKLRMEFGSLIGPN